MKCHVNIFDKSLYPSGHMLFGWVDPYINGNLYMYISGKVNMYNRAIDMQIIISDNLDYE